MQQAASNVNFSEIVKQHAGREATSSPSTLRKILGQDGRGDKAHSSGQQLLATYKAPIQRKCDLWLPRHVLAAVDSHVSDVCFVPYKTIAELVFKLAEICENDLHVVRAIYKYVLLTQLATFRRSETGLLVMRNFDLGIESTNTVFARLCSFAGIENRFVRGLWKTICQEPGDKVDAKCIWNMVALDSGCRFIQPAFSPVKFFSRYIFEVYIQKSDAQIV